MTQLLQPSAYSLIESLRDVGYTLEAALADIVDNSITAQAKNIKIFSDSIDDKSILAVVDDGCGMDFNELIVAMKIGSKNPLAERTEFDLGRFGLGLKTASFSQCRRLTVISRKKEDFNAMRWDLDLISKTNDWTLEILDLFQEQNLYKLDELTSDGTIVIWENIDRIVDKTYNDSNSDELNSKMNSVSKHLELVFHRYLDGENGKLKIFINNVELRPFDPFNKKNNATRLLGEESISIDDQVIKIYPYILPHHSKTTKLDYEYYAGDGGYLKNQGFYVYRNKRLLIHGTWFRLVPMKELYKLARVQIDLPNSLDYLWKIDIKKANAFPPLSIKKRLQKIIDKIVGQSTRVYIGKGHRESSSANAFWQKESARGSIKFSINKSHPFIVEFLDDLPEDKKHDFKNLLDYLGDFFPLDLAISEYGSSPQNFEKLELNNDILEEIALKKLSRLRGKLDIDDFVDFFKTTEPTNKYQKDWKVFVEKHYEE